MRKLGRPGVWQAGPMARRGAFFAIAAWVWIAIMLNNCSQASVGLRGAKGGRLRTSLIPGISRSDSRRNLMQTRALLSKRTSLTGGDDVIGGGTAIGPSTERPDNSLPDEDDAYYRDYEDVNSTTPDVPVLGPGGSVQKAKVSAWVVAGRGLGSRGEAACGGGSGQKAASRGDINDLEGADTKMLAEEELMWKRQPVVAFEECGDGACLFRSLARQVKRDEEKHYEVRQELVDFLESIFRTEGPSRLPHDRPPGYPLPRRRLTRPQRQEMHKHARVFFNDSAPAIVRNYLRSMRQPTAWGTSVEALAASYVYKRPVWVWMQDLSGPPDFLNPENSTSRAIGLLHVRGNHWNSVNLLDETAQVYGRNASFWSSASMAILRADNSSTKGDRKYLLLRTPPNLDDFEYTVPWGNIKTGETLQDGAMRRLREEIGLDHERAQVRCQNRSYMSREMSGLRCNNQSITFLCSIFLSELEEGVSMYLDPKYNASWHTVKEVHELQKEGKIQCMVAQAIAQAENYEFIAEYISSSTEDDFFDYDEDDPPPPTHHQHGTREYRKQDFSGSDFEKHEYGTYEKENRGEHVNGKHEHEYRTYDHKVHEKHEHRGYEYGPRERAQYGHGKEYSFTEPQRTVAQHPTDFPPKYQNNHNPHYHGGSASHHQNRIGDGIARISFSTT